MFTFFGWISLKKDKELFAQVSSTMDEVEGKSENKSFVSFYWSFYERRAAIFERMSKSPCLKCTSEPDLLLLWTAWGLVWFISDGSLGLRCWVWHWKTLDKIWGRSGKTPLCNMGLLSVQLNLALLQFASTDISCWCSSCTMYCKNRSELYVQVVLLPKSV